MVYRVYMVYVVYSVYIVYKNLWDYWRYRGQSRKKFSGSLGPMGITGLLCENNSLSFLS